MGRPSRRQFPPCVFAAIPVWAGVLHRFIAEMQIGDYVISPNKADRWHLVSPECGVRRNAPSKRRQKRRQKL